MKYDLSKIETQEPSSANERIASLRKHSAVVEYETRPNGDVVVGIENGRGHWDAWIVPANGDKLTTRVLY